MLSSKCFADIQVLLQGISRIQKIWSRGRDMTSGVIHIHTVIKATGMNAIIQKRVKSEKGTWGGQKKESLSRRLGSSSQRGRKKTRRVYYRTQEKRDLLKEEMAGTVLATEGASQGLAGVDGHLPSAHFPLLGLSFSVLTAPQDENWKCPLWAWWHRIPLLLEITVLEVWVGNFPVAKGSPVAKTTCSQCREPGSIPGQGTRSHTAQPRACHNEDSISHAAKTRHSQQIIFFF